MTHGAKNPNTELAETAPRARRIARRTEQINADQHRCLTKGCVRPDGDR
ncbi:hypothetical protein HP15_961 [Marinobacter adhaerens HP15]|uniref:Uncharacterized protein n=1 Tax=Marinobacter adhaerens (strain DSM 23420 / HP15) TaxID=225937 RepID=E4PFH6_MARAH|nr:hypothetical protein HP15_961 [Marinobacter adhaerens HP15]